VAKSVADVLEVVVGDMAGAWEDVPHTEGDSTIAEANRRVIAEDPALAHRSDLAIYPGDSVQVWSASESPDLIQLVEALQDYPILDETVEGEIRGEREYEAWDAWLYRDYLAEIEQHLGIDFVGDYLDADAAWSLIHDAIDRGDVDFIHHDDGGVTAAGLERAVEGLQLDDIALAIFQDRTEKAKEALRTFLGISGASDDQLLLLIAVLYDEGFQPRNAVGLGPEAEDYTNTEPVPRILEALEDPETEKWYLYLAERWIAWSALQAGAVDAAEDGPESLGEYLLKVEPVMVADDPVEAASEYLQNNPKLVGVVANPADIHAFPERPPRVEIGDRSYALSDDDGGLIAGAIGAIVEGLAAEAPPEEIPRIGKRHEGIIEGTRTNRWRWFWAYEPDGGDVIMWRWSDGDEKVWDKADRRRPLLQKLAEKGQLNTVTTAELEAITQFMRQKTKETIESMEAYLESQKTEPEREVDRLVQRYFDERVAPEVKRRIAEVERGVIPFGFRPFEASAFSEKRQAKSYTWGEVIKERFGLADVEAYVGQYVPLDQLDVQAVYWALNDVVGREASRYLR